MKIKRYIGKNTQEAMMKLKKEMGSDAVILHTRKIKQPGFVGLFKKSLVEVVAAKEEKFVDTTPFYNRDNEIFTIESNNINNQNNKDIIERTDDYDLNKNLEILQSTINKLIENLNKNDDSILTKKINFYKKILTSNGVDDFVATKIIERINKQVDIITKENEVIIRIIKHNIKEYLGVPQPIEIGNSQKVVFFVGPTGVGKTTTLAKIAAQFTLSGDYNIGLITADTYRIAAVEQLKIYSEIMKLPLEIVYSPEEIHNAIANFRDKDIILIDTAGRSHKNKYQIEELKTLLNIVSNSEIYLVLSATTDIKNIKSILEQYDFIENYKIIFTKVDECQDLGVILSTKFYTDKPLSYITTGQNVPEDIEIININSIIDNLVKEKANERSSGET